jgi:hypothetical protein
MLENPNRKYFYLIMFIYGLATTLTFLSEWGIGNEIPQVVVFLIEILLGVIKGLIWYFLVSAIFKWLGNLFGGNGTYEKLQIVIVCHAIPYVVVLGLWILTFILYGDFYNLSDEILNSFGFYTLSGIAIIAFIWSIVIFVIGLSEAHQFSKKKALLLSLLLIPLYWIGL